MTITVNSSDQAKTLRSLNRLSGREQTSVMEIKKTSRPTQVFSVTSGKGGVGKTAVVANLGISLARMGKRVLIIDADLGLANIDVIYGLTPRFNMNNFFSGEVGLQQIMVEGPSGIKILPAGSGLQQVTHLNSLQKIQFMEGLESLDEDFEVVLVDTEAGISENVTYFSAAANEILIIATSDPASITDAYTLMKLLSMEYQQKKFHLVVNIVKDPEEGLDVFQKLTIVANRFLNISINYLGCIPFDKKMKEALRRQKPIVDLLPDGRSSAVFENLAQSLVSLPVDLHLNGSLQFFWKKLLTINEGEKY